MQQKNPYFFIHCQLNPFFFLVVLVIIKLIYSWRYLMLSINSSCYSSSEIDLPNYEYPVIATSCGRHVLYTHDSFCVNQKKRQDYQLLYVKHGTIYYYIDKKQYSISAGGILIYKPSELLHYE